MGSVDDVFENYKGRRAGLLKAFNSGLSMLLKEAKGIPVNTPYVKRKVLLGLPDESWTLEYARYCTSEQPPQPQLLLAFDKGVHWHEWASRMADLSDAWLISMFGYLSKSFSLQEREDLIKKISNFRSLKDEITPECPVAEQFDMNKAPPVFKPECVLRRLPPSPCMRRLCSYVADNTDRDDWIQCDRCYLWYHCNCCNLNLHKAKECQSYHCAKCPSQETTTT